MDQDLQEAIQIIASNKQLTKYEVNSNTDQITKGENYFSTTYFVNIKGNCSINKENGQQKTVLNLVIKTALKSELVRKKFPLRAFFITEINFYQKMLPEFTKFQLDHGVKEPFNKVPLVICTSLKDNQEFIAMENLKSQGFALWNRKVPMDRNHVETVLRAYAQFHALSLGMNDQKPKLFENISSHLKTTFQSEEKDYVDMCLNEISKATKLFKDPKILDKLIEHRAFLNEELLEFLHYDGENSIALHGDGWCNNFLFKYQGDSREPTDIKLLDFQIMKFGPPVFDLIYFIFSSCTKEDVEDYETLLNIYHESLKFHMKCLGSDPEKVYPYSALVNQWNKYCNLGLVFASIMIRVAMSEENEVPNFEESLASGKGVFESFDFVLTNEDEYNDRIKFLVLFFINNTFL